MSTYPTTWVEASLGQLAQYTNGRSFSASEWRRTGLPIVRIQNLNNPEASFNYTDTEHDSKFLIQHDDILVAWAASLGAYVWKGGNAWLNQHIFRVEPNVEVVDKKFLYYALKKSLIELQDKTRGSGIIHLTKGTFESHAVPLPPLNEQKRIASKLAKLVAHIDACQERFNRIASMLKDHRMSILASATSGSLTEEWREEHDIDYASWEEVILEEVSHDFTYGSSAKSAQAGEVPVLRMGNIQEGELDWRDLVYTSDLKEIDKYKLAPGDVLFNRTNSPELVGKTAVFRGERAAVYAGYLIRVRCGEKLLPDFLSYCLNSPAGRHYCWQVKSDGVSQSNINAKKLGAFPFMLPTLKEQREVIRRVETLSIFSERLKAHYGELQSSLEKMLPSLLAKAFRGKLVAQDPSDMSVASVLEQVDSAHSPRKPSSARSKQSTPTARKKSVMIKATKSRHDSDVKNQPYLSVLIRELGDSITAEELFAASKLPIVDFYKQLAWEIDSNYISNSKSILKTK